MRILHTSDWHLGKMLGEYDRTSDYEGFLTQLLAIVRREAPDVLVVAGDVFDVSMPPTGAQALYYDFLAALNDTSVSAVVVTPGNHDSAAFLSAPARLLKNLRVFVAGPTLEAQCTILRDGSGRPLCAIAAVPYLKEGELRRGGFDMTDAQRYGAYESAVGDYYRRAAQRVVELTAEAGCAALPRIATAHLFVADAAPAAERAAWAGAPDVGSLRLVGLDRLGEGWDYLALGHLHKPQAFDSTPRARYCGSPLDLSFPKRPVTRHVVLVDFDEAGRLSSEREIAIEQPSALVTLSGTLADVSARLEALAQASPAAFVTVELTQARVARAEVDALVGRASALGLRPVAVRLAHPSAGEQDDALPSLTLLTPESVFERVLADAGYEAEEQAASRKTLKRLFAEVLRETQGEAA